MAKQNNSGSRALPARVRKTGKKNQPSRSIRLVTNKQMQYWLDFAGVLTREPFGFELPPSYLSFILERELENIIVLSLPVKRQRRVIIDALCEAAVGYKALLARTLQRAEAELPQFRIATKNPWLAIEEAVHDAIQQSETAIYRAPLWLDLFNDVLWPQVKRTLASRFQVDCDIDDGLYRRWIESIKECSRG